LRLAKAFARISNGLLVNNKPRRFSLRTQLVLLVLAVVLPLLALAAVMFLRDVQFQRAAVERGMKDTARALSLALDREVGKLHAVLETLAASPSLDSRDFKSFNELALRATEQRKDSRIVLFDRSGQQIINTLRPFGASLPNILQEARKSPEATEGSLPLGSPPTVKSVLETGEPTISDLFIGIVSKEPSLATTVPVIRDGNVAYGLSIVTLPENFTTLLREQGLPNDWNAVIVDRNGTIISRNPDAENFVGRPVSPTLRGLLSQSDHGWSTSQTSAGVQLYSAFARSKLTEWAVAIEAPQAVIDAAVNRSMRILGGAAAVLLFVALGTALLLGRRISGPISMLARSAEAIQRGERVEIKTSGVKEISELHSALLAAGKATREWAAEHERAVIEKRLRRLAEVSATLSESIDFEKTLARLVEFMVPDYADWCSIDLLQEGSNICRRVAVRTSRKDKEPIAEEFYRNYAPDLSRPHPILTAIKTGRTDYKLDLDRRWADQHARNERHRFLLEQAELSGVIVVPLRVQGRVAGALSMFASRYSGRKYTVADVEFAEEVGRRASIALDNAWLYREVQKELTERKQAEEALRESEERFRSTFENAPVGMAHVGLDGRWLRVNDTLCEITGYSRQELLAKTFGDITHPDDLEKSWTRVQSLVAGELSMYSMEKRYLRKDGSLVWVEITVSLRRDADGRPLYLIGAVEDITERKRAQEELRESEERFRSYFELGLIGMAITSPSKGILEVNEEICKTLGYERDELLRKTWAELTHPGDIAADVAEFNRILVGEIDGYSLDKRFIRKDGRVIYATISLKCLRLADGSVDYFLALVQDITERTQVARRRGVYFAIGQILAESPSLNEATPRILQTVGEALEWETGAMWIADLDANVLRCLKVWHDPCLNVDHFVSESYGRTIAPGVGLPGRVWTSAKAAWIPDVNNDNNFPRAVFAGEAGLHAGFAFPILFRGKLLGVTEFFSREIRQRDPALLAMFESIGSQIGQFMERKRAEEALREADRRKDEFLAMLGHELRNPLGVISTVVQLLNRKEAPDPEVQDLRNTIKLEVSQLARLLDDLLDISRIARGLIRLKKEPCDLATIVRDVAEGRRLILEKNRVDLSVQLPSQPVPVIGDRTRLAQIVGNLLDNANKFTDAGGQVTVRVVEEPTGEGAILTVRDNGIGMEPETLTRVFEPFTQAERTIDRSRGGLGLGLTLVKGLVDLHGGDVWASSGGAGCGSEFTIRLSLARETRSLTKPNEHGVNLTEGRRILVIEDNLLAARYLRMLLTETGHAVEVAHNGPDGIEVARRFRPEIVLCDIGLPGLDGYAVARVLREEPGLTGVYIIAVSGYGQNTDQRRASEEGFNAYLTKPIDFKELERLLTETATHERPRQLA
jgi:PAS domain S-box-containing protein